MECCLCLVSDTPLIGSPCLLCALSVGTSSPFAYAQYLKGGVKTMNKQEIQKPIAQKMVQVEMSAIKVQQLNRQPIIETSVALSKDKKWIVQKTIITDLKPVSYFEKVMEDTR